MTEPSEYYTYTGGNHESLVQWLQSLPLTNSGFVEEDGKLIIVTDGGDTRTPLKSGDAVVFTRDPDDPAHGDLSVESVPVPPEEGS